MGTTLTGTTPQDTYDSLIKVTDNGPLSGSLKVLTDGLGNNSAISLSTGAASVTGTLAVSSSVTLANGTIGGTDAIAISAINTNTNGTTFALNSAGSVGIMTFLTASTERMRITSAGNVGIGTSAPAAKLEVSGAFSSVLTSIISVTDTAHIYRGTPDGIGYEHAKVLSGIEQPTSTYGSFLAFYTEAKNSGTTDTSTEKVRITSNGYMRMAASTGGIQFNGDTAAANALDDYEEGTWTMGIAFGGAATGVTYSQNTGAYTKIGRKVTVTGFLQLSNKGSSSGAAKITGLPFTNAATLSNLSAATLWMNNVTFANQFQAYVDQNNTNIDIFEVTVLGSLTTITNADFANNSEIMVSATYFV